MALDYNCTTTKKEDYKSLPKFQTSFMSQCYALLYILQKYISYACYGTVEMSPPTHESERLRWGVALYHIPINRKQNSAMYKLNHLASAIWTSI